MFLPTCSCQAQIQCDANGTLVMHLICMQFCCTTMQFPCIAYSECSIRCAICWTAHKTNWTQSIWYVLRSKFNVCVLKCIFSSTDIGISTMLNNIQAICKWCAMCECTKKKRRELINEDFEERERSLTSCGCGCGCGWCWCYCWCRPLLLPSRIHNTRHFLHYFWCFRFACLHIVYFLPVIALERQL